MSVVNSSRMIEKRDVTRHQMGLIGAISYVVGVIGSGIFLTPAIIYQKTHSVGMCFTIWIAASVISTFGAFTYVELGTYFCTSGADFSYLCEMAAFASIVVCTLVCYPSIVAVQLQTFSSYLMHGFDVQLTNQWEFIARKLVETTLLWFIVFINCFSLRQVVAKFNAVASTAKILVIFIVISAGVVFLARGHVDNFRSPFANTQFTIANLLEAFFAALFTFDGIMPLAIAIGMFVVSSVYLASNVAYFAVLDLSHILESNAPIASVFAQRALGTFSFLIDFFICILMIGAVNSTVFSASRSLHAAAKRGYLPVFLSCTHVASNSPQVALFVHSLLVIAVNIFGEIEQLINMATFALW
ncbi:hypothetical protein M3Y98_00596300 [Aphelenchoides besseyi]|nr:hypothetical protein M3Y98_00596300 [Aphelenchoides besseyi]KAI6194026.1 hypothetical protein M3Y96_01081300 [Aphelenchoides besseyi]